MEEFSAPSKKLALVVLEDQYDPVNLEPKQVKEDRVSIEIEKEINDLVDNLNNSIFQLENALEKQHLKDKETSSAIEKIKDKSVFIKNHFDELLIKLDQGILSFADEMQINEETLEKMYRAAKSLYDENQYREAALIFNLLLLLEPNQVAFWEGSGHSEFLAENYKNALIAFTEANVKDPQNPIHNLMVAKCYEQLKEYQKALEIIDQLISRLGNDKALDAFKEQVKEIREEILAKSKQH